MDPEKVKQEFLSICYDCKNNRKPSGISTNFQLITKGIKVCQEFEQKQE